MGKRFLTEAEERLRYEVYARTKTDREAARTVGCHETTFRNWRKRRGLPSKSQVVVDDEEHERRFAAWSTTQNVHEAARSLGMPVAAFDSWMRKYAGLRSRVTIMPHRLDDENSKHQRYLRAYHQCRSDREAAALLGTTEAAFCRWRRRHKLAQPSYASRERTAQNKLLRRKAAKEESA